MYIYKGINIIGKCPNGIFIDAYIHALTEFLLMPIGSKHDIGTAFSTSYLYTHTYIHKHQYTDEHNLFMLYIINLQAICGGTENGY